MRIIACVLTVCFSWFFAGTLLAQGGGVLRMRFLDSQTGYAIQPQVIVSGFEDGDSLGVRVNRNGSARLELPVGNYTVTVTSEDHASMSTAVAINDATPPLQFSLDPLIQPVDLRPESIAPLRRTGATMFVGYVVGDESGRPLESVRVFSRPSGVQAFTDARGYFQIAIPLQDDAEWKEHPATLSFSKDGFKTEEHRNLELWSNGDWIFRVRLSSGLGTDVVDDMGRRMTPGSGLPKQSKISANNDPAPVDAVSTTNATLRLPTNIRVQLTNGTIDYVSMETYTARSLSQEWFPSWANYPGGINSLKAGAVAVRSYAASYVNGAGNSSTYDICATTTCQVYRQSSTSNGDLAAAQTAGYVVVDANNTIERSEYSAENNSDGFACGDGFTQPTGGCIADPVCVGETRFGHGRGMCQWGSAKWATGLKMAGNGRGNYPANADSGITNGYPERDWIWIINHYYPDLTLAQAKPLMIGDQVKVVGGSSRTAYMCADGGISSGTGCTVSNFVKTVGSTGIVTNGPVRVTSDGKGFTWWKVVWSDNKVGWIPENWLERVIAVPPAPINLRVAFVATNAVTLAWTENGTMANGYKVQRSVNTATNWAQIDDIPAGTTTYADFGVLAGTTNYYRIRAYNFGGNSPFSNPTNAAVPYIGPSISAIANKTVVEGTELTFSVVASAPDFVTPITDFESYVPGAEVMFRDPGFSGSTSQHLDTTVENSSSVVTSFPATASRGKQMLRASWSFKTGTVAPWLRLTTGGTNALSNPVINFTQKLRFDIYTDKSLKVALGARETTTSSGTAIGSNGGATGAIEHVGVQPGASQLTPLRILSASNWTTLTFDLPMESVANFASGNGILSTASGLGVLEHLALVPNGGLGLYNVYLDNFVVARPKTLTYSLEPGAPAGAGIQSSTGLFFWTPQEGQGPGTYFITVRVTDNQSPPQSATRTFQVNVSEENTAPTISAVLSRTVHAGNSVTVNHSAYDLDQPQNALTFSLDPGAPAGTSINSSTGIFSWIPGEGAIGTNTMIVRVTDDGTPPLSDTTSLRVVVVSKPSLQSVMRSGSNIQFSWNAISGRSYKLQFKGNLNDAVWTDLGTVTASSDVASRSEPIIDQKRFFRIVALD